MALQLAVLAVLLLGGTCARAPSRAPQPTTTPTPAAAATQPAPPGEPAEGAAREVELQTEDGLILCGTLFGPQSPRGVLLAHMFPTDQTSWHAFAAELAEHELAVLAFDFRGYGCSQGERDVPQIAADVQAALALLRGEGVEEVILVGASMGGTAVAKAAAQEEVAGVVVISAPLSFRGLEVTEEELQAITEPKLFLGSRDDPATQDTLRMERLSPPPRRSQTFAGSAHGTELLQSERAQDFKRELLQFILESLS